MGRQTLFIFMFWGLLAQANAKPIHFTPNYQRDTGKSTDDKKRAENSVYCHVRHHLGEYTDYIFSEVTPRIARELPQLLTPQQDVDGNWLQVGERLSRGDLFHGHIRVPIMNIAEDPRGQLHPMFKDSDTYHLQYHSFETMGLHSADWVHQLKHIENAELQEWLQQLEVRNSLQTEQEDILSGAPRVRFRLPKVDKLQDDRLQKFAHLWLKQDLSSHSHQEPPVDWLLNRKKTKLRILDPNRTGAGSGITQARSVVSTPDSFRIISAANLYGFIQPANIYFARRADHPAVEAVIAQAEVLGHKKIINQNSPHFRETVHPSQSSWQFQKQLLGDLREAFSKENRDRSIFAEAAHRGTDFQDLQAFAWDQDYIFAIRYSIHCDELK